jgi:uncharacterized protein
MTEPILPDKLCVKCGLAVMPTDKFCGHCGNETSQETKVLTEDVFSVLSPALLYYFITLILLATYKLTPLFPDGFEGMLIISLIDVAMVFSFWMYAFDEIKPMFSLKGFSFTVASLTVAGALMGSLIVSWIATVIEVSISDDVFYNTYLFEDTGSPFLLAILFICVQPAIFEEVAFRGFLFTNLQKITSPAGAVYITSFLFGIIHLAAVSLIWLVPIGLAFAFLRVKYNMIWYGVIGHFTYNFGITVLEFAGWF